MVYYMRNGYNGSKLKLLRTHPSKEHFYDVLEQ